MEMLLAELAVHLDGILVGGNADCPITGVTGYDIATEHDVTFIAHERHLEAAEASPAAAIIAPPGTQSDKPLIIVSDPRAAFARALALFDWHRLPMAGIDEQASIARTAAIHARAHIGAFAVIGERAVISEGCVIYPHSVIGDHVEVGKDSIIYPNVTIYPYCTLGERVIVHSGAVIGADGHGFVPTDEGWQKIIHLGTVRLEDDVEIGANTTVDRATTGATVVGAGTKIDNLVQVAHNVKIGPHCMILSMVGIAGSAKIGKGVIIAGQTGIRDHGEIGDGARLAVRSGITRDVPPGVTVSGYPAQPHAEEMRFQASLRRVPNLLAQVKRLEQRLAELEKGKD